MKKISSGEEYPVLKPSDIIFDSKLSEKIEELLGALCRSASEHNDGLDLSVILSSFSSRIDEIMKAFLAKDYMALEQVAGEFRLGFDEFIFIVHNTFKPLLTYARENSDFEIDHEDWMEGTCPFCGYLPDMGRIVEAKDNKRFLHCSLCENEWVFPRLKCASCGNMDHEKQGYFEFEDKPEYRIYYCESCRKYMKTIRVSKADNENKYDLNVEDIVSNYIDATMIGKGYSRP